MSQMIYFFGFLIIVFLDKLIEKVENKKLKVFVFLILSFFILTLVEFLGGHLAHYITGKDKWTYNKYPLSMGKYVNFLVSIGWSLGAFVYNKYLLKKVNKVIENMPKKLTIGLVILYIADTLLSFKNGF